MSQSQRRRSVAVTEAGEASSAVRCAVWGEWGAGREAGRGRSPTPGASTLEGTVFPLLHAPVHGDRGTLPRTARREAGRGARARGSPSSSLSQPFSAEAYAGVCWLWPRTPTPALQRILSFRVSVIFSSTLGTASNVQSHQDLCRAPCLSWTLTLPFPIGLLPRGLI